MTKHTQNLSFFKLNRRLAGIYPAWSAITIIASTCLTSMVQAQSEPTLKPVTVTAPSARASLSIGGQELPLNEAPVSATIITSEQIKASGAQRLADVFKFDSSVSDAYNAVGYIDYATVRGFVIDNKFNYRRDGLPISGDTAIGLANKDRIEILKGTSGIQAGTSAPGGMVNYIVKRPTNKPVRSLDLSADSNGQLGAAIDLGGRFGEGAAQGYRLNFASDRLNSAAPGTRGNRQQLSLAVDSRLGRDGLLEAEFEWSTQRQRNVPGLSVLGSTGALPAADPKLNLNQQAWSLPTEFEGLTGSLRYTQAINDQWQWSAHLGSQRLKTDDRIAFPFGCGNAGSGTCNAFYDNGDVDLYDFRSEDERRNKQAAQFKLDGSVSTGSIKHSISFGLLRASSRIQTQASAYNFAGTVNLNNPALPVQADPSLTQAGNTLREQSTELFATDMIAWNDSFKTWLGLRHTRLQRSDALNASRYNQSFTTPWLAASYTMGNHTLCASHGQGIESRLVPNLPAYGAQAGLPLAAQRSKQFEIGLKSRWALAGSKHAVQTDIILFDIRRPLALDTGSSFIFDGQQQHRGLELSAATEQGAWSWQASATLLEAKQRNATSNTALNGLEPTNIPSHILRANAAYQFTPDWKAGLHISHEGKRQILPDNSARLPAWTRIDASLQWKGKTAGVASTWQLGINNLLGKRYFQESPYQFGHTYLFPAQPRSLRLAVSMAL
jgi:iron complex outermembrane recepter protein